jgi:hypothetical protein
MDITMCRPTTREQEKEISHGVNCVQYLNKWQNFWLEVHPFTFDTLDITGHIRDDNVSWNTNIIFVLISFYKLLRALDEV